MAENTSTEDTAKESGDQKSAEESGGSTGNEKNEKKYSQAELDRIISKIASDNEERIERKFKEQHEAELKRLEEERLAEQGKYQELAEQRDAELKALKAERANQEFMENCRKAASELGYSDLADIALKLRRVETAEDFGEAIAALHEANDSHNKAAIEKALETGHVVSSKTAVVSTPMFDPKKASKEEKQAYIEEHGEDAYARAAYGAAGI